MSHEELAELLKEIEQIRTTIDVLQPEVRKQEAAGMESSRAQLVELRKHLARDMEQLHQS